MGTTQILVGLTRAIASSSLMAIAMAVAAPRQLHAQQAAHPAALRWGPYRVADAALIGARDPVFAFLKDTAERRRAWWLWPAAGAGAGALVGHLAGSFTECSTCEYNRPWQPAATGAVLGALAGAAVELTVRSLAR
jgi:hypothetical protein